MKKIFLKFATFSLLSLFAIPVASAAALTCKDLLPKKDLKRFCGITNVSGYSGSGLECRVLKKKKYDNSLGVIGNMGRNILTMSPLAIYGFSFSDQFKKLDDAGLDPHQVNDVGHRAFLMEDNEAQALWVLPKEDLANWSFNISTEVCKKPDGLKKLGREVVKKIIKANAKVEPQE